ncbi:MAG TPA: 2-amino-4-hydroxy-6-hydroxymethyldihydropteridine diphosphokinase, partial [Lysobacter sp.]|nr:2-amino-4-hydroxy-6-hydroxymethyldihydropteridine diphosphokinase [Lysobacter sp.]
MVFVGLGSNLGDSAAILQAAFVSLAELPDTRLLKASRLYRTPAWGLTSQPDFLNAVAMLD